jgi:hypothetical protein
LDSSEQKMQKAVEILRRAADTIEARGVERDQADGERTMESTVAAFNLLTGHQLTETQGWLFMALLKMRRALYGRFQPDDFLDGAAYFALAGEAAEAVAVEVENSGAWEPMDGDMATGLPAESIKQRLMRPEILPVDNFHAKLQLLAELSAWLEGPCGEMLEDIAGDLIDFNNQAEPVGG